MSDYRRAYQAGGCYFFTVVTARRKPLFRSHERVELLRQAFRYTLEQRPFRIDASVILPDHIHCVWTLPDGDSDFSNRWKMLKACFTRQYHKANPSNTGSPWQHRYWEHQIRDEDDFARHLDYIHYNPVKHGLVNAAADWPYSSFGRFVKAAVYSPDWGQTTPKSISGMNLE